MNIADKTILITAAVPVAGGNHDDLVTPCRAADCVAYLDGDGPKLAAG
jgi:hypothetical protein